MEIGGAAQRFFDVPPNRRPGSWATACAPAVRFSVKRRVRRLGRDLSSRTPAADIASPCHAPARSNDWLDLAPSRQQVPPGIGRKPDEPRVILLRRVRAGGRAQPALRSSTGQSPHVWRGWRGPFRFARVRRQFVASNTGRSTPWLLSCC